MSTMPDRVGDQRQIIREDREDKKAAKPDCACYLA
jgi:hypothetical protein